MKRILTFLLFVILIGATYRVWLPTGIVFTAKVDTDVAFPAQVFYTESANEGFSQKKSISFSVPGGRSLVWRLVPVDRIERVRFDFGSAPGRARLSDVRLLGRERIELDADDFTFSSGIEAHEKGGDGSLEVRFSESDPYVHCTRALHAEGAARIQNLWPTSPLLILWALMLWVVARFSINIASGAWDSVRRAVKGSCEPRDGARRIVSLDCLRTIAFLAVVFAHVLAQGDSSAVPRWAALDTIHWGPLGVAAFFILSGVSLSIGSMREGEGFASFYRKRLRAILPPFWFAYFVCAMVTFCIDRTMALRSDWLFVPPTLFGMDGYLSTRLPTCYLVGEWFVGCLLLVYLFAPALHRAVSRRPVLSLAVLFALATASLRFTHRFVDLIPFLSRRPYFNVLTHLFEFAFGMAFFLHVRPGFRRYATAAACSAVYLAVYFALAPRPFFLSSPTGILANVALFCCLCFCFDLLRYSDPVSKALSTIGKATYLAFLFHHRVIVWLIRSGEPLDGEKAVWAACLVASASILLAELCKRPTAALTEVVFGKKEERPVSTC